jgi:Radical SAM superfamily
VTLPWAAPEHGPFAVACLQAYIAQALESSVEVRSYAPYFSIPFALGRADATRYFLDHHEYGEDPYLLIYARHFGLPGVKVRNLAALCRRLSRARPESRPLTPARLDALARETRRFVDDEIGPQLDPGALNIVGFTMTFDQVYASLFTAQLLRESWSGRRMLFLFGGNSASLPPVAALFRDLGMRGFLVIGEGEKKLELIVRTALALPDDADMERIEAAQRRVAEGIVHTFDEVDLHERNERFFATQFPVMEDLALPVYDDYFATVRRLVRSDDNFALARQNIALLAEGSRGCFAHCDFCGQNATWSGFRTRSPQRMVTNLLAQVERYQVTNIMFVDNVCDTWAERFADALLELGLRFPCFMEMRANHPERFWTKLALAGLQSAQIGIESVSAGLLRRIGKGVKVIRNLATQKHLLELGVTSLSNLIVGHPRATVDDIVETRRVLSVVPHFRLFDLSGFHLAAASPLYEGLRPEEPAAAAPGLDGLALASAAFRHGQRVPHAGVASASRGGRSSLAELRAVARGLPQPARRARRICPCDAAVATHVDCSRSSGRGLPRVDPGRRVRRDLRALSPRCDARGDGRRDGPAGVAGGPDRGRPRGTPPAARDRRLLSVHRASAA